MLEKNIFVLYLINILISRHVNTIVYKSYQTVKLYIVVIFITSLYTSFLHRIFDSRLCDVLSRDVMCHMLTPDKCHFSINFRDRKDVSKVLQAPATKCKQAWPRRYGSGAPQESNDPNPVAHKTAALPWLKKNVPAPKTVRAARNAPAHCTQNSLRSPRTTHKK